MEGKSLKLRGKFHYYFAYHLSRSEWRGSNVEKKVRQSLVRMENKKKKT